MQDNSWTTQILRLNQNKSIEYVFIFLKIFLSFSFTVNKMGPNVFMIKPHAFSLFVYSSVCCLTTSRRSSRTKRSTFHLQKYTRSLRFDKSANVFQNKLSSRRFYPLSSKLKCFSLIQKTKAPSSASTKLIC